MPSSSARCAQLPRAADKVPFYAALKKYRDYLNGVIQQIDMEECVFSEERIKLLFGNKEQQIIPYNDGDNNNNKNDNQNNLTEFNQLRGQGNSSSSILLTTEKKKRGRPKKLKMDAIQKNGSFIFNSGNNPKDKAGSILNLSSMTNQSHGEDMNVQSICGVGLDSGDVNTTALLMSGNLITTPTKKKRGRPKKLKFSNDLLQQQQQQQQQHYITNQTQQQTTTKIKNNGLYPNSPGNMLSPYCDPPSTPTTLQHQQQQQQLYKTNRRLTPNNINESDDLPLQPSPPNSPNICAVDFEPPNPANASRNNHHQQPIMSPNSTDLMQQEQQHHHYNQQLHQHSWLAEQQQQHFQYLHQQEQQQHHHQVWQSTTQQQYDAYQNLTASLLHQQQHQLQQQPLVSGQHCDVSSKSLSGLESLVDQIPTKSTTPHLSESQKQQHANMKSPTNSIVSSNQNNGTTSPQQSNEITAKSAIGENLLYTLNGNCLGTPSSKNSGSTTSTPSLAASPISASTYGLARSNVTKNQRQQSPLHLHSPVSCGPVGGGGVEAGGGSVIHSHSALADVGGNSNCSSSGGGGGGSGNGNSNGNGFYSDFSVSNLVANSSVHSNNKIMNGTEQQQYTKIYSPHQQSCLISCATPTPTPTPPMTPTTTTTTPTSLRLPTGNGSSTAVSANFAFRPAQQTQNPYNMLYDNQQFLTDYQLSHHHHHPQQQQQQQQQQHQQQQQQQHHLQSQQQLHHNYGDMDASTSLAYTHAHHMAAYGGYNNQQQSGNQVVQPTVVAGYHHHHHQTHASHLPPTHLQPHHHHHLSFNLSPHHHHHALNTLNHHTHQHAHPHAHHLSMFEFERFKGTDIGTYSGF